jgi:hypothetical protein
MLSLREIDNVLQTYELSDILELNELTEADLLLFVVEQGFLKLPNPEPLDFEND